jgi:hypothetical protein
MARFREVAADVNLGVRITSSASLMYAHFIFCGSSVASEIMTLILSRHGATAVSSEA